MQKWMRDSAASRVTSICNTKLKQVTQEACEVTKARILSGKFKMRSMKAIRVLCAEAMRANRYQDKFELSSLFEDLFPVWCNEDQDRRNRLEAMRDKLVRRIMFTAKLEQELVDAIEKMEMA